MTVSLVTITPQAVGVAQVLLTPIVEPSAVTIEPSAASTEVTPVSGGTSQVTVGPAAGDQIALTVTSAVQPVEIGAAMPVQTVTVRQVEAGPAGADGSGAASFETVSQNIAAKPKMLNYTLGQLLSMVFDLGAGLSITKTFGYTSGVLTTITLSGDVPGGIDLVKTLSYSSGALASVNYS